MAEEYDVKKAELEREAPFPVLTQEEIEDRGFWIQRLLDAQQMRNSTWSELDDMDYLTWYRTNQAADNAYVPPKLNSQDVRVVTGTTHEKGNTLLSALLNYNFEAQFVPFDENDMPNYELGQTMASLVKKSREMEDWDRKRPYVYRELLAQGTVNVLETWFEERVREKAIKKGWAAEHDPSKFKLDKDEIKTLPGRGESTLLSGTQVFYGNIREPNIAKQPFVYTVEIMPYEVAKMIYGNFFRWNSVPRKCVNTLNGMGNWIQFRDWSLMTSRYNYVEVIRCFDKPNNCYQLFLNGVPMFGCYFPLTEVSPSGEYPIAKGDSEVMAFFAYAKSIPAKTKVDQAVMDEFMRLAILKQQFAALPVWANNTGKQVRRSMLVPAGVINDIDPTKLVPLFEQNGMTQSDIAFFEYMREIMESKSVNNVMSGDAQKDQTATATIELKKAQMMKLGQLVWGVVQLERQMAWLRNWNHLVHLTKPQMEYYDANAKKIVQKYRSFTVEDTLEDGREGLKLISMDPMMAQNATGPQLMLEEELLTRKYQKPVRTYYVDPEALREMKYTWHCSVQPTEEASSALDRTLFVQNVAQAKQLFGPMSTNDAYIKRRWAIQMKENPDEFWAQPQAPMAIDPLGQGMMQPPVQQQMMQGAQPSLKQLAPTGL